MEHNFSILNDRKSKNAPDTQVLFVFKNELAKQLVCQNMKQLLSHDSSLLGLEKNFALKKCGSEEVLSKNILVHKNHDPKKIGSKEFGQNWTSKKLR